MLWGVTRRYTFEPANSLVIDKFVRDAFLPFLRKAPGLIAYYWINAGDGRGVSVSIFADKAGADLSTRAAAEFIKTNLAELIGTPEVTEGQVAACSA